MTRFAISLPNFGQYFDPRTAMDLARTAEDSGWDAFFLWDHILPWGDAPIGHPWITLAAVATATERIRLGPMVTPLARRRPWLVAREAVTLDHLSNGRLILGVGLGFPPDREFELFGEDPDDRVRAEKLDEGLAILQGIWSGEPFSFAGKHYNLSEVRHLPKPVNGSIPIWAAAMWPNRRPLRRAARYEGCFVIDAATGGAALTPDDLDGAVEIIRAERGNLDNFDVVASVAQGHSPASYQQAGATWLVRGPIFDSTLADIRRMIAAGPPRP